MSPMWWGFAIRWLMWNVSVAHVYFCVGLCLYGKYCVEILEHINASHVYFAPLCKTLGTVRPVYFLKQQVALKTRLSQDIIFSVMPVTLGSMLFLLCILESFGDKTSWRNANKNVAVFAFFSHGHALQQSSCCWTETSCHTVVFFPANQLQYAAHMQQILRYNLLCDKQYHLLPRRFTSIAFVWARPQAFLHLISFFAILRRCTFLMA